MQFISKISDSLNRFMDVPSNDPDDARRRKLLNILLAGSMGLTLLSIVFGVVSLASPSGLSQAERNDLVVLLYTNALLVVGISVFYLINRYVAGTLAGFLFLLFLLVSLSFSDSPAELANGRSLFVYMIPVVMASVLLRPASVFVFAFLSSSAIYLIGNVANVEPNWFAMGGSFFLAIISWLSARSLEQALKDLRSTNLNLDKLVEQKTSELAATLSRELILAGRNQAILNSIADGVIVFDEENRSILANPALSELTDIPAGQLLSRSMTEFIQNEALSGSRNTLKTLFENPQQNVTGVRVNWLNKTLSASIARVQDSHANNIGTVAVFHDITREVELEKMKDTFMGIVSHELRTPLNAVLGYAEMLKEGVYGAVNDKQANIADRVMTNTRRLLAIVTDLLDQAQIQSGKLKIRMVSCKPAEMLETLHGVMDQIAADKGIEFITELDPQLPPVLMGDPERLQQVMVNLANNAVKFTEQGSVKTKLLRLDEANWQIITTDTGGGIPLEAQEYIFESFRQVEGSATRKHGGVGLGLSIVKQLVERMKGRITLESEQGKGSTFTITLPIVLNIDSQTIPLNG